MPTTISLNTRRIVGLLIGITIFLVIISFVGTSFKFFRPGASESILIKEWVRVVDVSMDRNIPTWFSSLMLLISSIMIMIITLASKSDKNPFTRHWFVLGIIFLLFSIDETAVIHENFSWFVYSFMDPDNILTFGWVLVGGVFTLIVGIAYLRFLLHLPSSTRNGFIVAAAFYVGGALAFEAISGVVYFTDMNQYPYVIISTLEETFEMLGIVTLIYTLLTYIEDKKIALQVRIDRNSVTQNAPTIAESEKRLKQP